MRRWVGATVVGLAAVVASASPAWACGGLIGRNGAVNLLRTTTLAGYHDGIEHYVTAFTFFGGGGAFGSIVPLPGVPSDVQRGGDWTLQRLVRETTPVAPVSGRVALSAASRAGSAAQVLFQTKVDALDVTVLEGGGPAVGDWARQHGFQLPPDAPQVLEFYARRSPIFLAATFDAGAARARGQQLGDGTPLQITIPTANPWVPLRILGLGHRPDELIKADVYLLTDARPALLPATDLARDEPASPRLLADLRADRGMSWIPASMWFSYLKLDVPTGQLTYDLAIDAHGTSHPSAWAAGLTDFASSTRRSSGAGSIAVVGLVGAVVVEVAVLTGLLVRRRARAW